MRHDRTSPRFLAPLLGLSLWACAPGAGSTVFPRVGGSGGLFEARIADLFFVHVDTGRPRQLAEPELAGEVTLLAILSTDSQESAAVAPILAEIHTRYRERGLALLGLAFDATGDFVRDSERVSAFASRYGLEFPFFLCGASDIEIATRALGLRTPVLAFPTFLFVGRGESRQSVHMHKDVDRLRAELEQRAEDFLDDPPDDGEQLWSILRGTDWTIRPNRFHDFSGDRTVFFEADGARRAKVVEGPDGERISHAVQIRGCAVTMVGTWRFDPVAGVLLHPLKFGSRMFPSGGSATPLLDQRGYAGEAGCVRALGDPEPVVRREALFALGILRGKEGRATEAIPLLSDPSLEVRVAAAWALGEAKERGAREGLLRLADHPNTALRCAVLSALGKMTRDVEDIRPFAAIIETEVDPLGQWALMSEMLD